MYTTELAAKTLEPTAVEDQLAEDYASVLDVVSRLEQALRDGAWRGVRDELDQLVSAAEDMWSTLSDPDLDQGDDPSDVSRPFMTPTADAATVHQLIAVYAQPHAVGRMLYPTSLIADPHLRGAVENESLQGSRPAGAEEAEAPRLLEPAAYPV
ncbi:hypothetical protein ACH4U6_00365 [Streptomyces netropsis]|uniref:hypothetical protein n=1 Tax=Streptomyces netropsis TaxID=55404 RepID=UPI0037AA4B3D